MFTDKLRTFIRPEDLRLRLFFLNISLNALLTLSVFLSFRGFYPTILAKYVNNHQQILYSFIPLANLLHFNQISSPNFINPIRYYFLFEKFFMIGL